MTVSQLRLVLETDDLDAALAFYRDVVGLTEREAYSEEDGARVHILEVPSATLELANPQQVRFIDRVEVGSPAAHTTRSRCASRSRSRMLRRPPRTGRRAARSRSPPRPRPRGGRSTRAWRRPAGCR